MKKMILSLATVLVSFSAFAADRDLVSAEFMKNDWVKSQISQALAENFEIAKKPELALLSGGCGFAGCDERILVTLAVSSKGVNSQTHVISAIATYYVTGRSVTIEASDVSGL